MRSATPLLSRFLAFNRRLSRSLGAVLPQRREDARVIYLEAISRRFARISTPALIVDVGGGRECRFAHLRPPGADMRIVAVDVSPEELAANTDVDDTRVADATLELPFDTASVDLVTSEAVLEHLVDTERFVSHCARVIRPGGAFISLFSSRFSPHAVANRVLPDKWSSVLLCALVPGSTGRLGFPAYYDRTYPTAMTRVLERHGFRVTSLRVSYYQSLYFESLLPLFVLSALYELCVRALGLRDLAAYVVVVAERR
jgi:SAM-dependent methyltransferase